MASSKFIEVLDTTTQPTYSGYNVSLEDILAETQRRCSTSDMPAASKPRKDSNSGASTSSADSSTPSSPTSPTMRNRLRRFTLAGVAKNR
ncbi:hypothetical protein BFW01_g12230 [Lasiodiplodia theobromae]|uniref:Uncharacterized protein n=2 Tax=Lasiodiplodia TaxID=66739 RepID=A0A5N5DHM7_9PEZI|nr:uncharacterized protein LTHEOB_9049 [Lasiodiplodia theobromae]KAB2577373.1 hypothetical protein DBV05_g3992 [Lasiodiplodia theobromae]KAF4540378.1 hypothetical protein LTHEOB_9049 [Lasiodiplodia theobromae]KAF9640424.1 hypothetical protein BFW01_g12230 [Lasiodiplodia theobromae]KAK0659993.1 hypothetical protein DIS24_g3788 [Lasiodiplodia hormozganensis]